MTNKERQKSLDKKKWLESEKHGKDLSGKMPYCKDCYNKWLFKSGCAVTQEEREQKCLCATAYNRMYRS